MVETNNLVLSYLPLNPDKAVGWSRFCYTYPEPLSLDLHMSVMADNIFPSKHLEEKRTSQVLDFIAVVSSLLSYHQLSEMRNSCGGSTCFKETKGF